MTAKTHIEGSQSGEIILGRFSLSVIEQILLVNKDHHMQANDQIILSALKT